MQKTISELKCGDKFVFKCKFGVWQKIDDGLARCVFGGNDETVDYNPDANVFVVSESDKCEVSSDSISGNEIASIIDKQMDKLKQDLILRENVISAVTVIEPNTGNQTVLGYKPNGVLFLISSEYPIIQFYGSNFGKGGMYSIGSIYSEAAAISARQNKLKEESRASADSNSKPKIGFFKKIFAHK